MIINIILFISLTISLVTDIKSRKILNIVTFPSILISFIYYISTMGLSGLFFSGKGFLMGLGLLLIPYILGGIGAGDVKLMASIGALMGTNFVFYSFIYTALIGGIIAISMIIKQKGFWNPLKNFLFNVTFQRENLVSIMINKDKQTSSLSFPYGVAIVLGTFSNLIWGVF